MDLTMRNPANMMTRREILEEALRESRLENALSQRLSGVGYLGSTYNNSNPILELLAAERALKQQRDLASISTAIAMKRKIQSLSAIPAPSPMSALSLLAAHLSGETSKPSCYGSKQQQQQYQQQQQQQQCYAMPNNVSSLSALSRSNAAVEKYPKQAEKPRRRPKKCNATAISFPTKLFRLLESSSKDGFEDIISFLPHGKGFMIHKPDKFSEEVLPKFFKTGRLSSFHRQLNLYGFKRITYGADTGAFYHEHFDRDDEKVVAKIERKKQRVPEGDAGAADRMAVLRALSIASAQSHY